MKYFKMSLQENSKKLEAIQRSKQMTFSSISFVNLKMSNVNVNDENFFHRHRHLESQESYFKAVLCCNSTKSLLYETSTLALINHDEENISIYKSWIKSILFRLVKFEFVEPQLRGSRTTHRPGSSKERSATFDSWI
jgi:hypothetical protein